MKISSFMDAVKLPELAKHFSNKVPVMVNEMMERMDDFVRSEEAYANTELPKGTLYKRLYPTEKIVGNGTRIKKAESPSKRLKDKKWKGWEVTKAWMNTLITFPSISSEDIFDEPLIVEAEVEGYLVKRVYVDEWSSVEVVFDHCFKNLDSRIKAKLKETQTDLVGFAGEISKPLGKIEMATLRAIPSTIHSMMKFPTPKGVATLVTRKTIIAECKRLEKKQMIEEESSERGKGVSMTEEVLVNSLFPDQRVTIGRGVWKSVRYGVSKELDTAYWGFLGVGTTHGYAVSSLMDMTYWSSEQRYLMSSPSNEKLILDLPSLTPPFSKETLYAYLVVAAEAAESYFRMPKVPLERDNIKSWALFTDGASNPKGSGEGLVLIGPSGVEYTYALRLTFPSTNNDAEYEALLAGLRISRKMTYQI
ncbi:reverse transcriptase domain-containing protein [Tanacetum coccineum]